MSSEKREIEMEDSESRRYSQQKEEIRIESVKDHDSTIDTIESQTSEPQELKRSLKARHLAVKYTYTYILY